MGNLPIKLCNFYYIELRLSKVLKWDKIFDFCHGNVSKKIFT